MWIYINNVDQVTWLKIRNGCGNLIYSTGQGLRILLKEIKKKITGLNTYAIYCQHGGFKEELTSNIVIYIVGIRENRICF